MLPGAGPKSKLCSVDVSMDAATPLVPVVRRTGLRATMADGVELVADAWHPEGDGRWPVLLQRLPYGRSVASTPVLPHPSWFAGHGYAVVVQDCRGRGGSGGTFTPFVDEGPDGAATVEWAARLPFADGRVATYGFSYQGLGQLYAAAQRPPSLRAIAPMMCAPDPYEGWTYERGLLRWPFGAFWAAQLAGQELGTGPVPFDVHALPVSAALGADPPPWFVEWLAHPSDDAYWAARRPDLSAIDVPAFTVLGWFDDFSSGTAELIRRLPNMTALCGPWAHMPWGGTSPAPVWAALLAFFDGVFGRAAAPERAVRYFELGTDEWRAATTWPPPDVRVETWRAQSVDGNANSRWGTGVLEPGGAGGGRPTTLVVEPHVPYPGDPPAGQSEAAAEDRRDVACFTSRPLDEPLLLAGSPELVAVTTADRPRHDLIATLVLVGLDGEPRALCGGGARLLEPHPPGEPIHWEIELRPIAVEIPAGSCLRLDLSGARFPCYDRNPHTERHDPATAAGDHVVATVELCEVELRLPVRPSGTRTD
jgi:putative CocE/NonD family hydrolase